jgi:hypothetical protein
MIFASGINMWINGGSSGVGIGALAGQTACVAIDFDHSTIWVRNNSGNWNGSGTANPATNTGGFGVSTLFSSGGYPVFACGSAASAVVNFGASAFTFTVPSGFSAWDVGS